MKDISDITIRQGTTSDGETLCNLSSALADNLRLPRRDAEARLLLVDCNYM